MLPVALLAALALGASSLPATDFAVLSPETYDQFVPQGKEVDAIYGDYVLRNEHVVAVIAQPLATRNANMTVRGVGGSLIDFTERQAPNDQLGAYYPAAGRYPLTDPKKVRLMADGMAVAALEGGGLLVELIEHATAKPGGAEPHLTHGFTKAGIIVDDFDRTVAALKTRGIPIVMGPFPPRPTMRTNLGIRDHAGNLIQIFGGYAAR